MRLNDANCASHYILVVYGKTFSSLPRSLRTRARARRTGNQRGSKQSTSRALQKAWKDCGVKVKSREVVKRDTLKTRSKSKISHCATLLYDDRLKIVAGPISVLGAGDHGSEDSDCMQCALDRTVLGEDKTECRSQCKKPERAHAVANPTPRPRKKFSAKNGATERKSRRRLR